MFGPTRDINNKLFNIYIEFLNIGFSGLSMKGYGYTKLQITLTNYSIEEKSKLLIHCKLKYIYVEM